ncbi:MAG TPA: VWA domain-containing protein, partial [Vicinamibacterales bacterium]|nr:VWA domain-containing protein [Vicinamibacterales bacterium]
MILLTATLLAYATTLAAQTSGQTSPQRPDPDAPAPFRVSVDVVAVDVQVIDREGRPVPDLGPDKFSVTINGRRRRVVSAERIGSDMGEDGRSAAPRAIAAVPARVIMIAVDCISFDATESRSVIQAARQFVRQLAPDDMVGLSAYPNGPKVDPTRDHEIVVRALDQVVGQRDLAEISQFHVRPSEIIDITSELYRTGGGSVLETVSRRECGGDPPDPFCRSRLITDVTGTALFYEGQGTASLGMLRTLVGQMTTFPGRKTMVLISGGMIASDSPGGRPDLSDLGIQIGKEAALANTAIYTLFLDSSVITRFSAQTRAADKGLDNWGRDAALLGRWLNQFSGAAGGALFNITVGNAEPALARINTELSSYYLLGVEPAEEDRDGRTHEIAVKTSHPNVTIRGRRWVAVPKRGAAPTTKAASAAKPEDAGPAAPVAPAPPPAPVRRVIPADVQALADAYDRGNYDSMRKTLAQSTDVASTIRGFRMSDSPWPNDPRRTAVFALELAFAGLRSDSSDARDEGGRLLGEYHVRVRQPAGADEFECAWFITESAALEGLFLPESAILFIPRALQRCPASARLHLAYAFVSEQQWLRGGVTPAQELEVVRRYEDAMKFPETAAEARLRAARFLYGLGQFDRASTILTGGTPPSAASDKELQYLSHLVRGKILRALGRPDEAAAALREA